MFQSIAETVQLKCRYCQAKIYRKNYKQHLQSVHPNQDSSDLTPHGQQKLTSMFSMKAPPDIPPVKKRRNESGESTDSGVVDITDTETDIPVSLDQHPEELTHNVSIDAKLDLILQEVKDMRKEIPTKEPATKDEKKNLEDNETSDLQSNIHIRNLKHCRSMAKLMEAGFTFDSKLNILTCSLCTDSRAGGQFSYDAAQGVDFGDDQLLPKDFASLKRNAIRHISEAKSHIQALVDQDLKLKAEKELESKNRLAGMNLGRLCMKNYLLGRPYTDYESDVLVMRKSGGEVGELNHSRMFPAAFRPYVAKTVNNRVTKYLQTPLLQTGHLPPACMSADKGTYKHRSRQFLGVITVVPGGEDWLVALTCGQPVVLDGSSGAQLAKNMKAGFDSVGLEDVQMESAVFDGVYFHCSIEEHLGSLYSFKTGQVLYTWDPLHKTGLVDKHMAKEDSFKWLDDITGTCTQIFNAFNWGASYEKFRGESATWKLSQTNLVNFSDTRFANSKRKVFKNIHYQFAPIITCLEDQVKAGEDNRINLEAANTEVRKKADKAKELHGKILNLDFLLILSGLADIYEKYGHIVQVTQMVRLLPHERLDLYNEAVNSLRNMAHCLNHHNCEQYSLSDDKVKCLWPLSPKDKLTYAEEGTIRGLPIRTQHSVPAAGLQVRTRRQTAEVQTRKGEDVVKVTDEKLLKVVKELATRLSKEVYSPEGKVAIEHTRTILDLPTLARKLRVLGSSSIKVTATEFPAFLKAVRSLPIVSLEEVTDAELKSEFRTFLGRLEQMIKEVSAKDLEETDPKELIKQFFDPAGELFINIEMIMQVY